jgi:hypothetical protein
MRYHQDLDDHVDVDGRVDVDEVLVVPHLR